MNMSFKNFLINEEEYVSKGKTSRPGRYKLKPLRDKPLRGYSPEVFADMGIDTDTLYADKTLRRRLAKVRELERMKGTPFISWVVAEIKLISKKPTSQVYNELKRGEYPEKYLEMVLSRVAKSDLGDLRAHELLRIMPHINWSVPVDARQLKELPPDNGFINDRAVAALLHK